MKTKELITKTDLYDMFAGIDLDNDEQLEELIRTVARQSYLAEFGKVPEDELVIIKFTSIRMLLTFLNVNYDEESPIWSKYYSYNGDRYMAFSGKDAVFSNLCGDIYTGYTAEKLMVDLIHNGNCMMDTPAINTLFRLLNAANAQMAQA